ncbi:hypothetical protein D3C77_177850 [compost metagenome]
MAGSRGAGQVGAAGDVAGLDVETGDGCQQLVDLIAPHARRHVRLDVVIEPSLGKQTDATDAGADQGPAAAVAGGLIRQGGRGRGAAEAAALHLPLALLQLQLLHVSLLLLLQT